MTCCGMANKDKSSYSYIHIEDQTMMKSSYLRTGISNIEKTTSLSWWLHQMETFSALLALSCREFTGCQWIPSQRPATRSFAVFFDLRLNKRLSKQSRHRWFETPSRSLWRHFNDIGTDPWFWCTLYRHVLLLDKTVIDNSSCFRIMYISWHVESYEVSWHSAMTQSISPWIKHLAKLDSVMVLQILLVGSRSETLKKILISSDQMKNWIGELLKVFQCVLLLLLLQTVSWWRLLKPSVTMKKKHSWWPTQWFS